MMTRNRRVAVCFVVQAVVLWNGMLFAQQEPSVSNSGVYFKLVYGSLSDPGFLDPGGGEDGPVVPQSRSTGGIGVGYEYFDEDFGLFGGIQYLFKSSFNSFAYASEGSIGVTYQDPEFSVLGFEFGAHFYPSEKLPLSLYLVFDIAVVSESYTFANAEVPDANGLQEQISARPGIGLGTRFALWKFLSLQLEYQWIVAASSQTYDDYLYSKDGYDYYRNTPTESTSYTKLLTVGIVVTF
ncbi:MAG TPA: hypothetical protein VII11_05885 [Bacteroidota bacterium]